VGDVLYLLEVGGAIHQITQFDALEHRRLLGCPKHFEEVHIAKRMWTYTLERKTCWQKIIRDIKEGTEDLRVISRSRTRHLTPFTHCGSYAIFGLQEGFQGRKLLIIWPFLEYNKKSYSRRTTKYLEGNKNTS
jgi:hypothetical protein